MLIAVLFLAGSASSFTCPITLLVTEQPKALQFSLFAQKKRSQSEGKGFGKSGPSKSDKKSSDSAPASEDRPIAATKPFLQSVESGSSNAIPVLEDDASLSPDQQAERILRDKYGMKTLEEQQLTQKQMENINEQRRKLQEMKRKAELNEEIDFIAMIPGPVQIAIDRFLKIGLGISGILFLAAGMAITVEAWSKTTKNELPEALDQFIVGTVEPNFTTGLLVLLGFSVSLGVFAAAQLGSQGAQYREDN
ncbi:hypothetical protein FisN_2Lh483 [Fistulifera solaris]|uniref:Uncharacterized protein n=1 Tax=Fistulifera solaris TaxID=1519565 RepID=A0A1Z5JAC9_FISSO|nr:hypothetical protein FisN_2Lh483 [Fistulifera solaris]|eukprot:GAX10953.1 hypothetical protein FisN_2Lh483 [Fistulifera solaris]